MSTKTHFRRNAIDNLRAVLLLGAAATAALTLSSAAVAADPVETVTVTGTLIQGNANLVSPVTVIDTTSIDQRGISSIQGAIQASVINNGPALTNSFTANGAFAAGASAVSLRGLSTNSSLVLFDGLRAAYYPLADDGSRNFVDLNTIPDDIVERVDILRDGASASYGADAIAGVVNIITKKEFQGFSARAEGGIADRGDAAEWKFSATAGFGDLAKDHVNAYFSAFYYHSDTLYNRARPYPFNTDDATGICYKGECGGDTTVNSTQVPTFALGTAGDFIVRPYTQNADGTIATAVSGSRWQHLAKDCGPGTSATLTTEQQGATYPSTVCQYDYTNLYGVIQPSIARFGLSGHTAFILPNGSEGYFEANFMQSSVSYTGDPAVMRGNAPAGIYYKQYSTSAAKGAANEVGSHVLYLPVYVCAERVNCDTAADRTLNPNNPFAAQGYAAAISGRDVTQTTFNNTRDRSYRVAGGLKGDLIGDVKYDIGVTAMHTDLRRLSQGYVYIQHLLDLINDGTYNFIDTSKNSQAVNDYLMPDNISNATSDEAQAQASISAPIYKLPGGDLAVMIGTSIAYEAIDAPSANSDINGATQRYFTLNAFGTKGSRDVYSGFFEISAPVIDEITLSVSGRYDAYSSGQSNFSPKFGVIARPFDQLTLKGTYSEGFRIPSFGEANALPTTGYVTNTKTLFSNNYLSQYGCTVDTFNACPTYIRSGSWGQTTLATPDLQPEKSRSWVFDTSYQPLDGLMLTVTYYNIKKTGAITAPTFSDAATAYYSGEAIPSAFTVLADAPDPNNPTAKPRIYSVSAHLINANTVRTAGWDFGVTYDSDLNFAENLIGALVHLTSSVQTTFIQNLDTQFPDGHVERYDGTLGNYNLTAGSGTPKWRGTWQNTFGYDIYEFTGTLNWTSGYNLSAMDQGTEYRDCGLSNGNTPCRTADYFTFDVNTKAKLREDTTVYFTMLNVLDAMPPIDNITYGAHNYNPVTSGNGILGRYLKLGIKFDY